jgi:hypothetical protein
MKLTKSQLKQIIKEELQAVLEDWRDDQYGAVKGARAHQASGLQTPDQLKRSRAAWTRAGEKQRNIEDENREEAENKAFAFPPAIAQRKFKELTAKLQETCPENYEKWVKRGPSGPNARAWMNQRSSCKAGEYDWLYLSALKARAEGTLE